MNRTLKQGVIAVTAAALACGDSTGVIQKPRTVERTVTYDGMTHTVTLRPNGDLEHRIDGRLFAKQQGMELTIYGKHPTILRVHSLPRVGQRRLEVSALFTPAALQAQHAACARELAMLAGAAAIFVGAAEALAAAPTPSTAMAAAAATAGYVAATYVYASCEQREYDRERDQSRVGLKMPEF